MKKIIALAVLLTASLSAQAQTWTEAQGCIAQSEVGWSDGTRGEAYVGYPTDAKGNPMGYMVGATNRKWNIKEDFDAIGIVKFLPSGTVIPITIGGLAADGGQDSMLIFRIPPSDQTYKLMTTSSGAVFSDSKGGNPLAFDLVDIYEALTIIYQCSIRGRS